LRAIAVITEREPVRHIVVHIGLPTEPPPLAHARDPTETTLRLTFRAFQRKPGLLDGQVRRFR
jgi:hypothetical protein